MEKKWTHLLFALLGAGLFYLFLRVTHVAWEFFRISGARGFVLYPTSVVLAISVALLLWKNERIFGFVSQSVDELQKIAWPSSKDTFSATLVVVGVVLVISLILGVFDSTLNGLMRLLYERRIA